MNDTQNEYDLHTIPGWYWVEAGYESESSHGPFMTKDSALRHAAICEAEEPYAVYLSDLFLRGNLVEED